MGEEENLIEDFFERAGKTKAIGRAGKVQAKKNMLELLQKELQKGELENPKNQY
jgi:hypothetical protein